MKFKIIVAVVALLPVVLFAQSDLQTALKGGELLLSGLSIFKTSKGFKSDSKTIESVCVKNKLVDKITFRIFGKNEQGDDVKKELVIVSSQNVLCEFFHHYGLHKTSNRLTVQDSHYKCRPKLLYNSLL